MEILSTAQLDRARPKRHKAILASHGWCNKMQLNAYLENRSCQSKGSSNRRHMLVYQMTLLILMTRQNLETVKAIPRDRKN